MLQNHPGELDFPTKREFHPKAFHRLNEKQQAIVNGTTILACIALVIAMIGGGVIGESPEPMVGGWIFVACMTIVGLGALVVNARMLWRAANLSVSEQKRYYDVGKVPQGLSQVQRKALQLDGVNAASLWTETIEYWPVKTRIEQDHVQFQTFELEDVQSVKKALDSNWGVLSKKDFYGTLAALQAGMHCQNYLHDVLGERRNELMERLVSLTGFERAYIDSLTIGQAFGEPPKLIWAWDLWRIIPLCRDAFMAGFVTEEEAWAPILETSRWLHALFNSLEEYHKNLCVGYAYWSTDYASVQRRIEVLTEFEKNIPYRPIRELSWDKQPMSVLPENILMGLQGQPQKPSIVN